MNQLGLSPHAKVNLRLDILGKRPDGYHERRTIFQKISLHDDLTVAIAKSGIEIVCDNPLVPCNESNLAHVAARMLLDRYGIKDGVRIAIKKRIPLAAGLGGGSSNAASTLEQPVYKDWLHGELILGYFWPRKDTATERGQAWAIGAGLVMRF